MNLLSHKQLKRLKAVDNRSIAAVRWKWFLFVFHEFFFPHKCFIWIKQDVFSNKQICGQSASFLPSTSITTDKPGLCGFTRMNQFHLHCRVHEPLYVLWKMCNYWFSGLFVLPGCLTCLLFLKWFLFTNQKSSKREHMAFVFFITIWIFFMPYSLHFMYEYVWHRSEVWNTSWKALPT